MRVRRGFLVAAALAAASVEAVPSAAVDNTTAWHWHNRLATYRIEASLPSNWTPAVDQASAEWGFKAPRMWIGKLSTSGNPVWRGNIPAAWQTDCPPATTLACTSVTGTGGHIDHAEMVFNQSKSMGTSSFNCTLSLGIDVQTVATHEFGHFGGFLDHTGNTADVMFASYDGCQRVPSNHDAASLTRQVDGH